MSHRIQRLLSATLAIGALGALMIHASTSGCSSPAATTAVPESEYEAKEDPAAAPPPAAKSKTEEESFFPASKAGTMHPPKSRAPQPASVEQQAPVQQQAPPQPPAPPAVPPQQPTAAPPRSASPNAR